MEYDQAQLNRQVLRIPLYTPMTNRDYTLSKDGWLLNCFKETTKAGKVLVRKRPGLATVPSLNYSSGFATGQGMTYYGERFYAIANNTLYRLGASQQSYTSGTTWSNLGPGAFGGLTSPAGVVFKGRIFLIGGLNGLGSYSNGIWSSQDGVGWAQVVPTCPWDERSDMQVVVFNEQLFAMSGGNGGAAFNDVYVSDDGINWSQLTATAPWSARRFGRAIVFNNHIIMMGGADAAAVYNNEVWSSADGVEWQQLPTPPWAARGNFACFVYNSKLYVVGGNDAGAAFNNCYSTPDGLTWTLETAAAFATARFRMGFTVYDNKMWVLGGRNAAGTYYADVYSSTNGSTWTLVTAAPGFTARSSMATVTFPTPLSVSSIQAMSMWTLCGTSGGTGNSDIYYATINATGSTSFSLTTTAPTAEPMQFSHVSPTAYLVFKNTYNAWVLWGNSAVQITDKDYPSRTVPGVVYLNQRIYVLDPEGIIYGSSLADPLSFSAFNFTEAEYEPDAGVAIAKYLNYVVAFGTKTIQFFYDTGAFLGSPLTPQLNMVQRIGCANGYTVVNAQNTLIFAGIGETGGIGFYTLDNGKATKISTTEIDRLINSSFTFTAAGSAPPFAASFSSAGHYFYICTFPADNLTLAFDMTEQEWSVWQYNALVTMPFSGYATDGKYPYFQYSSGGIVYQCLSTAYGDAGIAITCQGITDPVDFGTYLAKFERNVTFIGDRPPTGTTSNVLLYKTDDDYQTYIGPTTISLNQQKPWGWRGGRFFKRAYKWVHSSATAPLRLEALEVQVDFGNV